MLELAVVGSVVASILFLLLPIKIELFASIFLMTSAFDILPPVIFGVDLWDVGVVLLFLAGAKAIPLRATPITAPLFLYLIGGYLLWIFFCFLYSLFVYGYPLLFTIKASRQMLLGYASVFVLLSIARRDKTTLPFLLSTSYLLCFLLMPVAILQYLIGKPILHSLSINYEGDLRTLPIFLPFCTLHVFLIISRWLTGARAHVHNLLFASLTIVTLALTFTRGIYLSFIVALIILPLFLIFRRRISLPALSSSVLLLILAIPLIIASGSLDRVAERLLSGLTLVFSPTDLDSRSRRDLDDNFSGRLNLLQERASLVLAFNPFVGYGFLHEENVPQNTRLQLRFGTPLPPPPGQEHQIQLYYILGWYTSDISWANIILTTGFVGACLLGLFFSFFIYDFVWMHGKDKGDRVVLRLAAFCQFLMFVAQMLNSDTFYRNIHLVALVVAIYILAGSIEQTKGLKKVPVRNGITRGAILEGSV